MPENRFTALFAEADLVFNSQYKNELNALMGLSRAEIDSVIPGTTDLQVYSVLIKVVERAAKDNLTQAELIEEIKELGDVAIKIAKKVPHFTDLL